MIMSKIQLSKNDIENLKASDLIKLNDTIKQDFSYHKDFRDFDISNIIEYSLNSFIVDLGENDTLKSKKDSSTLIYKNSSNELQELKIAFQYID